MSQRDKPRLALNNITAGVREREEANRTRVAGNLDEIQGAVASTTKSHRQGAVGFIDWLDGSFGTHWARGVERALDELLATDWTSASEWVAEWQSASPLL